MTVFLSAVIKNEQEIDPLNWRFAHSPWDVMGHEWNFQMGVLLDNNQMHYMAKDVIRLHNSLFATEAALPLLGVMECFFTSCEIQIPTMPTRIVAPHVKSFWQRLFGQWVGKAQKVNTRLFSPGNLFCDIVESVAYPATITYRERINYSPLALQCITGSFAQVKPVDIIRETWNHFQQ
jgi:hypothetical protein